MTFSIVIPCYNEVNTIGQIIAAVRQSTLPNKEIIVVDDGSSDGTRELLQGQLASLVDRLICHEKNLGKGAAVRSAFSVVTGNVIIIQDADLEYDPRDYGKLVAPIMDGKADMVYGSRFLGGDSHRVLFFWHSVGNKLLTLISNMLTDLNLTDMETGYKAFRRELVEQIAIEENRFGFEPEITAKAAKLKLRIYEVGISYSGRTYAEGKKIGWKDGVKTIWCIVKYNLLRGVQQQR